MNSRKPSQDRKQEIIAATLDLAFEVGPDHVTTGMIAGRLGLTQPAIYKHFPKKDDIWQAVSHRLCQNIRENLAASTKPDAAPLVTLRHLVLGHLRLISTTPALPEIMTTRDPGGHLTKTRRPIQDAMIEFRTALHHALTAANQSGHLYADFPIADGIMLIFGIIQSVVLRLIVTRNPALLEQDGQRLLDLQLALFTNKGNAP